MEFQRSFRTVCPRGSVVLGTSGLWDACSIIVLDPTPSPPHCSRFSVAHAHIPTCPLLQVCVSVLIPVGTSCVSVEEVRALALTVHKLKRVATCTNALSLSFFNTHTHAHTQTQTRTQHTFNQRTLILADGLCVHPHSYTSPSSRATWKQVLLPNDWQVSVRVLCTVQVPIRTC